MQASTGAISAGTCAAEPVLCFTLRVGVVPQSAREAAAVAGALTEEGRGFTALLLSCSCTTLVFSMSRLSLCSARCQVTSGVLVALRHKLHAPPSYQVLPRALESVLKAKGCTAVNGLRLFLTTNGAGAT